MNKEFLRAAVVFLFLFAIGCSKSNQLANGTTKQTELDTSGLRIQNGWSALPKWMAKDLPFDSDVYYAIKDDENRELPYLQAFFELSFYESQSFLPNVSALVETDAFKMRWQESRDRDEAFSQFYDRCDIDDDRFAIPSDALSDGQRLLSVYEPGIELLKTAQQRNRCFFHCEVESAAINPAPMFARSVTRLLAFHCNLNLARPNTVDHLKMCLQLCQDLRSLADTIGQLSVYAAEDMCFYWIAQPILQQKDIESEQLDDLIGVLVEYHESSAQHDLFLEAARYEHLMFKNLLHQLENGTYLTRPNAKGVWDDDLPAAVLLVRELNQLNFYPINSDVADEAVAELAENNPEIAKAATLARESEDDVPDSPFGGSLIDSMVAMPLLTQALESMSTNDFENEIEVLNRRYRQIEAACRLPFPDSTRELSKLDKHWTTDDSWHQTKILKWFQPHDRLASKRAKAALRVNAFVGLAAIRKWMHDHEGAPPATLEEAMQAFGRRELPLDPFSGEPLQMKLMDDGTVSIYSVGYDGVDDGGQPEIEFHKTHEVNLGDIVFKLKVK